MTLDTSELADVGRLLSYALQPKIRPGADSAYLELIGRYCDGSGFRQEVDAVARGLGVEVLYAATANPPGFYIRPLQGSPFVYTLAHFREERNMKEANRIKVRGFTGIVMVAVAAYVYPKAEHMAEDRYPVMTPTRLDEFIRDGCERLKSTLGGEDTKVEDAGREPAWKIYLREPQLVPGKDGRATKGTLVAVKKTLESMADRGLLSRFQEGRNQDDGKIQYQPHPRLRQQILRGAPEELTELFDTLSSLRLEQQRGEK